MRVEKFCGFVEALRKFVGACSGREMKHMAIAYIEEIVPMYFRAALLVFFVGEGGEGIARKVCKKTSAGLVLIFTVSLAIASPLMAQSATPTFESMGLSWSPGGSGDCQVRYRPVGGAWKQGLDLWYDARNKECRGSLVHLRPGTQYEVALTQGSRKATLTSATWSENFPVASTVQVPSSGDTYTITQGGSPSGYVLYTGPATITKRLDCVKINASYVIVRGIRCEGGSIEVQKDSDVHDVVIEENYITGWGGSPDNVRSWEGAVHADGANIRRLVIQRNTMVDALTERTQPYAGKKGGAMGVHLKDTAGNHVVRYNDIYATKTEKYLWDPIGGSSNFSLVGVANDSDFYGNYIKGCVDDCMELEGGGRNMRVWGNFTRDGFLGIALAIVSIGPTYVWRNVDTAHHQTWTDCCGWLKVGGNKTIIPENGGRIYVFHNTLFNGPNVSVGWGGHMRNTILRNNIFDGGLRHHVCYPEGDDWDYDLYGSIKKNGCASFNPEPHGYTVAATYASTPTSDPLKNGGQGSFALKEGTKGYDAGERIPGFNDNHTGTAPDMGAHEAGSAPMQFGVNAYRGEIWGGGSLGQRPTKPSGLEIEIMSRN